MKVNFKFETTVLRVASIAALAGAVTIAAKSINNKNDTFEKSQNTVNKNINYENAITKSDTIFYPGTSKAKEIMHIKEYPNGKRTEILFAPDHYDINNYDVNGKILSSEIGYPGILYSKDEHLPNGDVYTTELAQKDI